MVVTSTDLVLRLSGGLSNCNPDLSLGGEISTTSCGVIVTNKLENLFDTVTNADLTSTIVGSYNYRCIYIFNNNPSDETLQSVSIWIQQNTVSPFTDVDIGLGLAGTGEIEQTIPDENTPPKFIGWTRARSEEFAVFIGNLPADSWKSIWIRRHAGPAPAGTSYQADNYIIRYRAYKIGIPKPDAPPGTPPPSSPPPAIPPPPPIIGNDQFGVKKIYADALSNTSTVSPPVYITNAENNCQLSSSGIPIALNPDGSWRINSTNAGKLRVYIGNVSGCAKDVIDNALANLDTYNHSEWASRGYIWRSHDFKSVEITGYFKILNASGIVSGSDAITIQSRGGIFNTAIQNGCGGPAYKASIYDDGLFGWAKKHFHNTTIACGESNNLQKTNPSIGSLRDKWFGFKMTIWNYIDSSTGLKAVHMESYIDKDANNAWVKVSEKNDTGEWYAGSPSTACVGDTFCGAARDQILTWGSPVVEFGWNVFPEVHFKWLSVREISSPTLSIPPPPPPTSVKLSVSSVTAKGNDGNIPTNVNDGNLSTRWSHSPIPSWIKLNLGSIKRLTGIKIAWYNGNTRVMGFRVDCENDNGADIVSVFSGNSSGRSAALETYNFTSTYDRKYVTVHVLANSANTWASITEIEILGTDISTPAPPPGVPPSPPTPPPPGPTPPPPPAGSDKDVFGINKIYTTKTGDNVEWAATAWSNNKSRILQRDESVLTSTCTKDPYDSKFAMQQVGDAKVTIEGNGIMRAGSMPDTSGSPRVTILGTWKNVESTVYARCPSSAHGTSDTHIRMKTDHYCVTTGDFGGYIIYIDWQDQAIYFKREKSHAIGYTPRLNSVNHSLPANTWIGIKGVCYTLANGNVKLECWIDDTGGINGGNWVKRAESTDNGTWSGAGGGTPIFSGSHGGSAIRTDTGGTINGYIEYKQWTVREINPPT